MRWSAFRGNATVVTQVAIVVMGIAALAMVPPAQGKMLLVPLDHSAARRLIPLAISLDARLVARGPFPTSMVIYGEQARLLAPMWHAGVLILAAPPAGCGAPLEAIS